MKARAVKAGILPPVKMACPYCGGSMRRRDSRYGLFYGCSGYPTCTATVGCHPDGRPLGTPANEPLKKARIEAHAAFDVLWKGKPPPARMKAYEWLAGALGILFTQTHIGMFDQATCERVVELCKARAGKESERCSVSGRSGR